MSKPLAGVRDALEAWMRTASINVAADVVPPQGDVGSFTCEYHKNMGKGADIGLTLATVFVKIYVSRAHEPSGHRAADEAQSTLQESLEGYSGPWHQLLVQSSDVVEENLSEGTYEAVRFTVQIWV
jgi:hypothetical protein